MQAFLTYKSCSPLKIFTEISHALKTLDATVGEKMSKSDLVACLG